jgi:phosphatidate cytidylyltransferase
MEPPPPLVSALTSLMCICLSAWTYASNGASTAALAVSSFALLSLQLLTVNKLKFAQLASSVFGLFYCGAEGPLPGRKQFTVMLFLCIVY